MQGAQVAEGQLSLSTQRANLLGLLLVGLLLHLWGIDKMLPFIPDVDEGTFVGGALQMLTSGSLNPGFFGHPGSTTIYPLAIIFRLWNNLSWGGVWWGADPAFAAHLAEHWWEYYMLGRYLSAAYNMAAISLVFVIGKRAFNPTIAVAGAWLYLFYGAVVYYARTVRTDTAGLFFALLAMIFVLRVLRRPALSNQLLAGIAIGLAAASRYFLGVIGGVLLLVDMIILVRTAHTPNTKPPWGGIVAGLFVAPLVFVAVTPYLVLDITTALADLRAEARASHLGADGLSPLGNLVWYLTVAIPDSITWLQWVTAFVGIGFIMLRRQLEAGLLLLFSAAFLVAISLSALHWHRWIIPIMPYLALFTANGVYGLVALARQRAGWPPRIAVWLVVLLIGVLAVWPAWRLTLLDIRQANDDTRLIAREWMVANLPEGSRILQEPYSAPLQNTSLQTTEVIRSLADEDAQSARSQSEHDYWAISSTIYDRFYAEAERYPKEIEFYETLFAQGKLVYRIDPSYFMGGPTIQIYQP